MCGGGGGGGVDEGVTEGKWLMVPRQISGCARRKHQPLSHWGRPSHHLNISSPRNQSVECAPHLSGTYDALPARGRFATLI